MMRATAIVFAAVLLTACGKKVDSYPEQNSGVNVGGREVHVQDYTTPSGVKCVVATMYSYGPAISCDWK